MKYYSSFSEIDQQLKILKLQREIAGEGLKYRYSAIRYQLRPSQIISGFRGSLQKSLISVLATLLLRRLRSSRSNHTEKKLVEA